MPKYTRHADGYSTIEHEGGPTVHLIDPDGSFEREMQPPSPEAYAAVAPPQSPAPVQNSLAGVSTDDAAALAQPSTVGPMNNPTVLPDQPKAPVTVPPIAPAGQPRATLIDQPGGGPAMATKSETQTTNQHSTSTSGMDQASKAKLESAGAKTTADTNAAINAERQAGQQVSEQRQARAKQDYQSGFQRQVGALDAEQQYKQAYSSALEERKAARAQKIDPSQAWGGEKQEWAFIAGLGGALAALDSGVARLNAARGRGYAVEPYDMIDKMVQASIKQQEDQRKQRIESAGESAEAAQAGMLSAASDAHEAAAQVLEARKLLASSAEEATFLDSAAAKQRLQADLRDEDRAKMLATTVTKTDARNTVNSTQTGPAAGAKPTKAQHDDQANLRQLYRLRDTLQRASKSGALQGVVGWQDKLGANSVQEFFGGLPPEQKEAATALGELEIGNLMRLVREPNNKNTQNMVQSLGMPKNDSDIPGSLQRLDQLIADQEDAVKNAAPEAPAEQAEQY
jgi:hypothetical protein